MAEDLDLRDARPLPVMDDEEVRRTFRVADAMVKSGQFPDVKQATQAFTKILAGRDLGLSAYEAMDALHIIEGKLVASAQFHASRVAASDKYEYEVKDITDVACEIRFYRYDPDGTLHPIGDSVFTMDDAARAGLIRPKSPWEKYPRNMLFARAISNGVAWFCPDVMGGLRVYTPGELSESRQDVTAGEGEYVEPEDIPAKVKEWAPSELARAAVVSVLDTARELGHRGLADYGTTELALKGQPEEAVIEWCRRAASQLEELEARPEKVEEAQVVDDRSALELEQEALRLADEADAAEVNEEPEKAEKLRAEAAGLHDRVQEMTNPKQMEIDDG